MRPAEQTYLGGVLLGAFAALALFAARESAAVGASLALAAGAGLGYGLRSARARDQAAAGETVVTRMRRA